MEHYHDTAPFSRCRESQRSSTSHKHAMPVQLRPLHPISGPLAQSSRASACRAEGRGSKARTDRQFSRARSLEGSTVGLHPARDGALPSESTLLESPVIKQVGCRSVKADAMVRIHPEEPISKPARCNSIAYAASNGRGSRCNSWCGHHFTEHVRHRRGNGPENRCAPQRRPECNG